MSTTQPYLHGIYAPTLAETPAPLELDVIGNLPEEINGSYFRNGPNPRFAEGFEHHHWFDGDGMIHKVQIREGRAYYQNRWVETRGLKVEQARGRKRFHGLTELGRAPSKTKKLEMMFGNAFAQLPLSPRPKTHILKDTANTDVIFFDGKIIPLWWLSGTPYAMDPETLRTTGIETFKGTYHGDMAAHARIDPETGDLFFLDFGQLQKYVSVHRVSPDGKLRWKEHFELPYPRIFHDLLFTRNFVVLMDFPLGFIGDGLNFDRYDKSRIVLIHREDSKIQLVFEFPATYVLHGLNAYEENFTMHLSVTKYVDPLVTDENHRGDIPEVGALRVETVTALWTLDLKSGTFSEKIVDDTNTEFARINDAYLGKQNKYSYHPRLKAESEVAFDGLIKYDLSTGAKSALAFGDSRVGEEAVFIPRKGATDEDDGWISTLVHDQSGAEPSEFRLYDAKSMDAEPVARVMFPRGVRVPPGFHGKWISN